MAIQFLVDTYSLPKAGVQGLINGGAIEPGESGFLLVQVVGNLAGAADVYTGGTVPQWAAAVEGLQPGLKLRRTFDQDGVAALRFDRRAGLIAVVPAADG